MSSILILGYTVGITFPALLLLSSASPSIIVIIKTLIERIFSANAAQSASHRTKYVYISITKNVTTFLKCSKEQLRCSLKRWVFKTHLKFAFISAHRITVGSSFHNLGASLAKVLQPAALCEVGTASMCPALTYHSVRAGCKPGSCLQRALEPACVIKSIVQNT